MEQKLEHKLANFGKALTRLEEACATDIDTELEKDGLIQRYEFTFELCWKTLQEYFMGRQISNVLGPRDVLMKAFELGLTENQQVWADMLSDRNLLTHTYDQRVSDEIFLRIKGGYCAMLRKLFDKLSTNS